MKRNEPARGVRNFFRIVLPALIVLLVGSVGILVLLTWRVTHPAAVQEPVTPSQYLLTFLEVNWANRTGDDVNGWWISGKRGAPGIILSPGYGMGRSDVLSLAALLNNAGYHVLIYAQRGCGPTGRGANSLGLYEREDLESALGFLMTRPEVNIKRIGFWGADEGARAALAVAASHPEVRAIAVDTPYEYILEFFAVKLREEIGVGNWLIENGCREVFRLSHLGAFGNLAEPLPVHSLTDRSVLFITGLDRKEMAPLVTALYDRVQAQKEKVSLPASRSRLLSSEELNNYDRQVSNFFRVNLANAPDRDR